MRTTLKRGVGRGAHNGNGKAVFPPGTLSTVTRYRQPPPPAKTALGLFWRIVIGTLIIISSLVLAVAGGAYLYFHQSVATVRAHTPSVVRAAKTLDIPLAHQAAIALVVGYDHRAGVESNRPSLSDTLMLVRADPSTNTISLLSFPRDLDVPIYCPRSKTDAQGYVASSDDRINSAYSRCGPTGTVLTVKHLTGLPINYLITVNFHGFKEVVDKLGGVWMDVDRRYFNKNTGAYYNDYANINLQPGYQQLSGQQALDFVRFRHTDDDLHRNARQQEFVQALRAQVSQNFSYREPAEPRQFDHEEHRGRGGWSPLHGDQVISYALFAQSLPAGHVFQNRIENVQCSLGCQASLERHPGGGERVPEPGRRVVEERERSRARDQDQAEGAVRPQGDRDGRERERRARRGRERRLPARPARPRLPGGRRAERDRRRTSRRTSSTRRSTTTRRRKARSSPRSRSRT